MSNVLRLKGPRSEHLAICQKLTLAIKDKSHFYLIGVFCMKTGKAVARLCNAHALPEPFLLSVDFFLN